MHVTHGDPAQLWVRLEDGTVRGGIRQADNFTPPFDLDGTLIGEATFVLPADLPLGYHRVHLRSGDREFDTALIVTPAWLGMPARMGARAEPGAVHQLYSVRSAGSWGFGDLADLTDLAVWAGARHGADYVLINPCRRLADHTDGPSLPADLAPFRQSALPAGRGHPEYAALAKRDRVTNRRKAVQAKALKSDVIDRDRSLVGQAQALHLVFQVPRSAGRSWPSGVQEREGHRAGRFRDLVRTGGEARRRLAPVAPGPAAPGELQVAEFAQRHRGDVEFTAGCSGNSTTNWRTPSHRRCGPA